MPRLPHLVIAAVLALAGAAGPANALTASADPSLTADEIMARVAANQDKTEAARRRYVYLQHIRMVSRKPGGRVMCEEVTDSRVSPQQKNSSRHLLALDGRYWRKGSYIHYTTLPKEGLPKEDDGPSDINIDGSPTMDRDLVESLRRDLSDDKSKDGLARDLFPLTTEQQSHYRFSLLGRQTMNGHDVFHVSFMPRDKDEYEWKGDAYVDAQAYQPVVVATELSRKIPLAVRTLLGTNLPGLGFSVTYERQPDGLWFPVSFGTEFRMRLLFFINRDVSMSLANTHFEQTHTDARILNEVTDAATPTDAKN